MKCSDTARKAYSKGITAAHDFYVTGDDDCHKCPYSRIYEQSQYDSWYKGFAYEMRRLNSRPKKLAGTP